MVIATDWLMLMQRLEGSAGVTQIPGEEWQGSKLFFVRLVEERGRVEGSIVGAVSCSVSQAVVRTFGFTTE